MILVFQILHLQKKHREAREQALDKASAVFDKK